MNRFLFYFLATSFFLSSLTSFALTKKAPPRTGEQEGSLIAPTAPGAPPELRSTQNTRLEAGKAIEPGRGLPSGEQAYDLHAIDPKSGDLVPIEVPKKKNP